MRRPSKKAAFCLLGMLVLSGCQKYYLSLTDQNINVNYLASTHVGTPDKRQHNPPYGEMIVMDWRIPKELLTKHPVIDLHVIYGNYTEKTFHFPLNKRMGYVTYKDLNEEYADTKGIITYSAQIRLEDGSIYKDWKHQLWANLITVDDEKVEQSPTTETSESNTQATLQDPINDDIQEDEEESEPQPQEPSNATSEEGEEDESHSSASSMSSCVEDQSIQGSVTETEDLSEEVSSDSI